MSALPMVFLLLRGLALMKSLLFLPVKTVNALLLVIATVLMKSVKLMLKRINGGELGGAYRSRNEVLDASRNQLNQLAFSVGGSI